MTLHEVVLYEKEVLLKENERDKAEGGYVTVWLIYGLIGRCYATQYDVARLYQ